MTIQCPNCEYPAANDVTGCHSCGWNVGDPLSEKDPRLAPEKLANWTRSTLRSTDRLDK
jgi:hypothetical protein